MSLKEKMTALADAVRAKADLTDTLTIDEMTDAVNGLVVNGIEVDERTLTVTPSKSQQTFSSSDLGENTYYSTVTVNAIPAEYITTTDATAVSSDILYGKTAYINGREVIGNMTDYGDVEEKFSNTRDTLSIGANGYFKTIKVNLVRKTLEVTPTKSAQTLRASSEGSNVFYTQVNVAPIPSEYIITTDATATSDKIIEGETAYVKGEKVTGTYIEVSEDDVRSGVRFGANNTFGGEKMGIFTSDATAAAEDIAPGKTAYAYGIKLTGTMPSKEAENYTPGYSDIVIQEGIYLAGDQTIKGDPNLLAHNIKQDVTIFGVKGSLKTLDTSDATATAALIAEGKTAYVNGEKITGTLPISIYTVDANVVNIPAGYYIYDQTITIGTAIEGGKITPGTSNVVISDKSYLLGKIVISGDGNLTADNIKTGVSIFNVEGTFTSDATAAAEDIASGKTAYVKGEKITGTASLASGYNKWMCVSGPSLCQLFPTSKDFPVPYARQGNFHYSNGRIFYRSNSFVCKESDPLANVEYLISPQYPNNDIAFGIADGHLYYFWIESDFIKRRLLIPERSDITEMCTVNGDRCVCRAGNDVYAAHRDGSGYYQVSDLSASKMLNYYSYSQATVITTSGDIARVYWYDYYPSYNISDADKGNGNPFTNVNYVSSEDFYLDSGGAAYMLAFRETGFWYKNIFNSDSPWIEKTDAPDLIRTNWLGYCVTSREEYSNYDPDTGEESWGYINRETEVALHIDTSGRLWKIAAACDDNGNGTGLNITQVGSDSDWQCVPPSIKSGEVGSNRRFAQKGGKLIALKTDNEHSMGITWGEYPFCPDGRMIAYSGDGPTVYFSVSGKLPDLTRAGGMI